MTLKNRPHPGTLIRTEIIEAIGLNVSKAAEIKGAPRHALRPSAPQGRADS